MDLSIGIDWWIYHGIRLREGVGIWTYGELPYRQGLRLTDSSHVTRGCSLLVAVRSSWKHVDGGKLRQLGSMAKHALSFIAFPFILCYWQKFYPYGTLTYPFWKDLETLTNEFNHKGTSPIRLVRPLIRIEQQSSFVCNLHLSTSSVELKGSHYKS